MSEDAPTVATVQWNQSIETLLASYADNAKCFEWMHTEAYAMYNARTRVIMITINVLTAFGGLSNVIAGGQTVNGFQFAWIFGSLSILITLFNMLQEKLAYAQMAADFNQYSINWGSISRKIVEELAIPPVSRQHCESFLIFVKILTKYLWREMPKFPRQFAMHVIKNSKIFQISIYLISVDT